MTIEVNSHTLTLFEDIRQMPDIRKQIMERYLLLSEEVGSTTIAYQNKQHQIMALVERGMQVESAEQKNDILIQIQTLAENSFMNVGAIENTVSFTALAFAVLVESVDNEKKTDTNENALTQLVEWCSNEGMSHEEMESALEVVRKKSLVNLRHFSQSDM